MAVGAVQAEDVKQDRAFRGVNDLADPQERFAAWDPEQFGRTGIGSGGVYFFICVTEFDIIVALQSREQRLALQRLGEQS